MTGFPKDKPEGRHLDRCLWWDLRSINFQNFDQNIKCCGKYWIGHSKYQATNNRWSYHLVWMRKHTYKVSLKEFLKLFKCLASSHIHMVSGWLDLLSKALHQERKKRMERICTRLARAPWVVVILTLFIEILYEVFFIKTLIIMSTSTNINKPYVCDLLGPYIVLVNSSIDQITSYWSMTKSFCTVVKTHKRKSDKIYKTKFTKIRYEIK